MIEKRYDKVIYWPLFTDSIGFQFDIFFYANNIILVINKKYFKYFMIAINRKL